MRTFPTQQQLHELFDLKDGVLYWRARPSIRASIGGAAGSLGNTGRLKTGIKGRVFLNHRIIFMMHYGWLPTHIDHIDGNPLNNRPENLRPASKSENACNTGLSAVNKSGFKGVYFREGKGKWAAAIKKNQRRTWLGYFDTPEEAALAYRSAAAKLHGEFARIA